MKNNFNMEVKVQQLTVGTIRADLYEKYLLNNYHKKIGDFHLIGWVSIIY